MGRAAERPTRGTAWRSLALFLASRALQTHRTRPLRPVLNVAEKRAVASATHARVHRRQKYKILIGMRETVVGDYSQLLARSKFCLVTMGDGWSARSEDAILHGEGFGQGL